jgi:hypothetical protein
VLDRVALGYRAQVVDPGQFGPGNPEPAVLSSRRQQDLLALQFLARVQDHRVRRSVYGHHVGSGAELDVVRLIPVRGLNVPALEILFRPQICLGQRRTANGIPGSRPTITTDPPKPSSRRVAAAVPPALPPPTITIGFVLVPSVIYHILLLMTITLKVPTTFATPYRGCLPGHLM